MSANLSDSGMPRSGHGREESSDIDRHVTELYGRQEVAHSSLSQSTITSSVNSSVFRFKVPGLTPEHLSQRSSSRASTTRGTLSSRLQSGAGTPQPPASIILTSTDGEFYQDTSASRAGALSTARPFTASSYHHFRSTTADGRIGSYVCAVLENQGLGREVGIAAIEESTGKCILTQFADTLTYLKTIHHLSMHPPSTIIVPHSALGKRQNDKRIAKKYREDASSSEQSTLRAGGIGTGTESPLVKCLEDIFCPEVTPSPRKNWNHEEGARILDKLLVEDNFDTASDKTGSTSEYAGRSSFFYNSSSEMNAAATTRAAVLEAISPKYYALSACCALFEYIERVKNRVFSPHSLQVKYTVPEGTVLISSNTARDLELVHNLLEKKSRLSLYGTLNKCTTPMGERLLMINILQPMTDRKAIEDRYDAVEECIQAEERFYAIQESLKPLKAGRVDLDKLIHHFITRESKAADPKKTETNVANVLTLRTLLRAMAPARAALERSTSTLLSTIQSFLSSSQIEAISQSIDDTINEEILQGAKSSLGSRNAKVYAIKANRSPLLDVSREMYRENMSDIEELCDRYSKDYGIPFTLRMFVEGFLLVTKTRSIKHLPDVFTNVVEDRKGKSVTMLTLDLKKKNARLRDSLNNIYILSESIIEELRMSIVDNISVLYRVSEALAVLDLIASLAHVAAAQRYIRPELTTNLVIKNAKHPILDRERFPKDVISNDVNMPDGSRFCLVTGPNMSGKSTYLRQVALLTIMAMIGSFVPAEYASFPVPDAILTRLSNNEDTEQNLSTFANEMRSTAFILSLASARSLVILDELGRGTSPEEGKAIAQAVSEDLISRHSFTFFATHYLELSTALSPWPSVILQNFKVSSSGHSADPSEPFKMIFHHKLQGGRCEDEHYGLELAKLAQLPPDMLQRAYEVTKRLEAKQSFKLSEDEEKDEQTQKRRMLVHELVTYLEQLRLSTSGLDDGRLRQHLLKLQSEFVDQLERTYPGVG